MGLCLSARLPSDVQRAVASLGGPALRYVTFPTVIGRGAVNGRGSQDAAAAVPRDGDPEPLTGEFPLVAEAVSEAATLRVRPGARVVSGHAREAIQRGDAAAPRPAPQSTADPGPAAVQSRPTSPPEPASFRDAPQTPKIGGPAVQTTGGAVPPRSASLAAETFDPARPPQPRLGHTPAPGDNSLATWFKTAARPALPLLAAGDKDEPGLWAVLRQQAAVSELPASEAVARSDRRAVASLFRTIAERGGQGAPRLQVPDTGRLLGPDAEPAPPR